jgi:DNA-binding beta-propeller fold protein YncE
MRVWWTLCAVACAGGPAEQEPRCEAAPGVICGWAGTGQAGFNGEGLQRTASTLYFPMDIVFSPYGQPVLSDWNNHKLRLVEDDGTLTTIMGTDFVGDGDADRLDTTVAGAPGTEVALNHPTQQRYLSDGTLLSASWHTHKLRTWDPQTGMVHVLAGATPAFAGDNHDSLGIARFDQPVSVELDADENVWVVDMRNERVRMIDMAQQTILTTVGDGEKGYCGDGGPAREACLSFPRSENPEPGGALAFSPDGRLLYVADTENHVIRVVDLQARTIELYAGSPQAPGDADGDRLGALFHSPRDLEMAPDGTLYVADSDNHKIRALDTRTGLVSTFAGTGQPTCEGDGPLLVPRVCDAQASSGDGGDALSAALYRPFGVALDLDGNLVVADTFNHRLRLVYRGSP